MTDRSFAHDGLAEIRFRRYLAFRAPSREGPDSTPTRSLRVRAWNGSSCPVTDLRGSPNRGPPVNGKRSLAGPGCAKVGIRSRAKPRAVIRISTNRISALVTFVAPSRQQPGELRAEQPIGTHQAAFGWGFEKILLTVCLGKLPRQTLPRAID